ncbi:MAG: alpha-amylase [Planctomycetales bacterium]|nr:alpha-amylase [Planctomycetales bacterium]
MHRYPSPSLYQLNTRIWLNAVSRTFGRPMALADVPDSEWDRLAELGVDWIWLLSVWQTGPLARQVSLGHDEWLNEFRKTLPEFIEADIGGSGFAIQDYTVAKLLGGDAALCWARDKLRQRGLRLMLDFVPNHMGLDHPWAQQQPDYFVQGSDDDLAQAPQNYVRMITSSGPRVFAYGRDPFFTGWPDTLQLNYGNPALQLAMSAELQKIANQCDGVRCDMAMLLLPDVFERTWGIRMEPFWSTAIQSVRERHSDFVFLAEVYWDREWTLQQHGFDYTYDKRLYDRLRSQKAEPVRDHLRADMDFQHRLARFLENHDEPRAAATFSAAQHEAAAIVTYLTPGLRFFHQGQFEGFRQRVSPHLVRGPKEPTDERLSEFYRRLRDVLRSPLVRDGDWWLIECAPAWHDNWTWNGCVAFVWSGRDGSRLVVVVNLAPHRSQCLVQLPFPDLRGGHYRLTDLINAGDYDWDGDHLAGKGLYVDLPEWGYHVLEIQRRG